MAEIWGAVWTNVRSRKKNLYGSRGANSGSVVELQTKERWKLLLKFPSNAWGGRTRRRPRPFVIQYRFVPGFAVEAVWSIWTNSLPCSLNKQHVHYCINSTQRLFDIPTLNLALSWIFCRFDRSWRCEFCMNTVTVANFRDTRPCFLAFSYP